MGYAGGAGIVSRECEKGLVEAVDSIVKPADEQDLIERINKVLGFDRGNDN